MGKNSAIGWTHHTFNPWWGCEKPLVQIGGKTVVSPECVHCYAETWDKRCGGANWGRTAPRRFFGEKHWQEPYKWNREAQATGQRHRVFCLSMGDVLEDRPDLDEPRVRLWETIRDTPSLDWLLLTKRAERFDTVPEWLWKLPNVWPGVTAGTQPTADLRIPPLLALKHRYPHLTAWVSVEPMLEAVQLWKLQSPDAAGIETYPLTGMRGNVGRRWPWAKLDWVVIGGESGAHARPFDVRAARALMRQCQESQVPVFWKQFGARAFCPPRPGFEPLPMKFRHRAGADPAEWPEWAKVQQFPK